MKDCNTKDSKEYSIEEEALWMIKVADFYEPTYDFYLRMLKEAYEEGKIALLHEQIAQIEMATEQIEMVTEDDK